MNEGQNTQQDAVIDMATFLVEIPPGQTQRVVSALDGYASLVTPDIELHCTTCDGTRVFDCRGTDGQMKCAQQLAFCFLHYWCRNCEKYIKTYAIAFALAAGRDAELYKIGEFPPFGPPLPSKLISMVRADRELFAKGQRAENQGLGIAAFAYYRRVVENQKNQLLDEIRKVAEREDAGPELLAQIEAAKQEQKFAAAVDKIKKALPTSITIDGRNPLTLLHGVLSANLHEESDESCLELATAIREVLTEFADRLSRALKDEKQLKEAVSTLAKHAAAKKPSS